MHTSCVWPAGRAHLEASEKLPQAQPPTLLLHPPRRRPCLPSLRWQHHCPVPGPCLALPVVVVQAGPHRGQGAKMDRCPLLTVQYPWAAQMAAGNQRACHACVQGRQPVLQAPPGGEVALRRRHGKIWDMNNIDSKSRQSVCKKQPLWGRANTASSLVAPHQLLPCSDNDPLQWRVVRSMHWHWHCHWHWPAPMRPWGPLDKPPLHAQPAMRARLASAQPVPHSE